MLNRYFGHEPADEESLMDWARELSNGAWYMDGKALQIGGGYGNESNKREGEDVEARAP